MERMDNFNVVVAELFAMLHARFPFAPPFDGRDIARKLEIRDQLDGDEPLAWEFPNGDRFGDTLVAALRWLRDEDYIRTASDGNLMVDVILTSKGLSVMNAVPEGLNEPLGKRIADATTEVSTEARRATIGELIRLAIGGALGAGG